MDKKIKYSVGDVEFVLLNTEGALGQK